MPFSISGLKLKSICLSLKFYPTLQRCYHSIPFFDLYQNTIGHPVSEYMQAKFKKKYPILYTLNQDRLQCSLQILKKFSIDASEACSNPHVFCINPISMDNYGEILRECGFVNIVPNHLIRYRTLVKSRTIAQHKKEGFMRDDIQLEEKLQDCFKTWPPSHRTRHNFPDSTTSISLDAIFGYLVECPEFYKITENYILIYRKFDINANRGMRVVETLKELPKSQLRLLTVRLSVLESYLTWKLKIMPDEFKKYCQNYLPLKHKPMHDIEEALNIAENDIKFDINGIRRNGFIISADPINTEQILENVDSLAGIDIRHAIRIEPAILKNNYNSLLQIRDILEEYKIPQDAQRRCLKVFCMCPKSVRERLDELKNLKEYNILSTNPRVLSMVIHKRKMMSRLSKIQAARKQCYSLNHLVSSSKVFNEYISSFGNKVCGRDIAVLITSSLEVVDNSAKFVPEDPLKFVLSQLRRHKFWLHAALNVVDENIYFLKQRFQNEVILKNCQILLYPVLDIDQYIEVLLHKRDGRQSESKLKLDAVYGTLKCENFTDDQILSLGLYEIEKKYHFSGDGIWTRQDGVRVEALSVS